MTDTEDRERFPVRRNPRLKGFDYSSPNWYFVTICTWEKQCLFGSPKQLSPLGEIARQCLNEIGMHFPCVTVEKSVIMPNHVHAIISLTEGVNLSAVVGLFKSAVTKQVHEIRPGEKVWQTSFHDHIIRSRTDFERIWLYIDNNPGRWMDDCFYTPDQE